jgi:hypothetical protein
MRLTWRNILSRQCWSLTFFLKIQVLLRSKYLLGSTASCCYRIFQTLFFLRLWRGNSEGSRRLWRLPWNLIRGYVFLYYTVARRIVVGVKIEREHIPNIWYRENAIYSKSEDRVPRLTSLGHFGHVCCTLPRLLPTLFLPIFFLHWYFIFQFFFPLSLDCVFSCSDVSLQRGCEIRLLGQVLLSKQFADLLIILHYKIHSNILKNL